MFESAPRPFHTFALDLIVKFPHSAMAENVYVSIVRITDKFSKALIPTPRQENYIPSE